jgi:cytochrome c oxidase cbb3-type subunit III
MTRQCAFLHMWLPRCAVVTIVTLGLAACEREQRDFKRSAPAGTWYVPPENKLQPGPVTVTNHAIEGGNVPAVHSTEGPYANNAYGISQGQRLFDQFNCSGCHSHGGGGMGPALMDQDWIYGNAPAQIFTTIVEGRRNGMPAFRGKLTTDQVWMLVAYVQTLSGQRRKDVRPGRRDNMQMRSSEQNTQTAPPRTTGTP